MNYSGRSIKQVAIKSVKDDGRTVTWDDGWTFGGIPEEHRPLMVPGAEFLLETRNFSMVTGMKYGDRWLWHKTDEDLAREHAAMVARHKAEAEARWSANEADWREREERLPLALRRRLERFRANGGHDFDRDGWGYELVVCELAVLYAASGQEDDGSINEYASRAGTSGNQHDYAKALSRLLTGEIEDEDAVANSVSALTPITGNPDYAGDRDA